MLCRRTIGCTQSRSRVALVAVLFASALPAPNTRSDHAGARNDDLETWFWQAIKLKQWRQIEATLAPGVIAINRGEILHGRGAVLDHLKAIDVSDFETSEIVVEHRGDEVVVALLLKTSATRQGEPINHTLWRMMSVWRQVNNRWAMIAHAAVPAE
jgi:ketosteroid isomerase-like protein